MKTQELHKLISLYKTGLESADNATSTLNIIVGQTANLNLAIKSFIFGNLEKILTNENVTKGANFVMGQRLISNGKLKEEELSFKVSYQSNEFSLGYFHKNKYKLILTAPLTILDDYTNNLILAT